MTPSSISETKKQHLDRIREHYDPQTGITKAAETYREMLARYFNLLIPTSGSVLEVGCGGGELLALLNGSCKCGVDVSPGQIQRAKEKVRGAEFLAQAGEELNLPDRTFDYIVLSETLNLAVDVQLILERLNGVCSSGTRLLINVYSALWRPLISLAPLWVCEGAIPKAIGCQKTPWPVYFLSPVGSTFDVNLGFCAPSRFLGLKP